VGSDRETRRRVRSYGRFASVLITGSPNRIRGTGGRRAMSGSPEIAIRIQWRKYGRVGNDIEIADQLTEVENPTMGARTRITDRRIVLEHGRLTCIPLTCNHVETGLGVTRRAVGDHGPEKSTDRRSFERHNWRCQFRPWLRRCLKRLWLYWISKGFADVTFNMTLSAPGDVGFELEARLFWETGQRGASAASLQLKSVLLPESRLRSALADNSI